MEIFCDFSQNILSTVVVFKIKLEDLSLQQLDIQNNTRKRLYKIQRNRRTGKNSEIGSNETKT